MWWLNHSHDTGLPVQCTHTTCLLLLQFYCDRIHCTVTSWMFVTILKHDVGWSVLLPNREYCSFLNILCYVIMHLWDERPVISSKYLTRHHHGFVGSTCVKHLDSWGKKWRQKLCQRIIITTVSGEDDSIMFPWKSRESMWIVNKLAKLKTNILDRWT